MVDTPLKSDSMMMIQPTTIQIITYADYLDPKMIEASRMVDGFRAVDLDDFTTDFRTCRNAITDVITTHLYNPSIPWM